MRAADASGVEGDWQERGEASNILFNLLSIIGSTYLPYLNANATAARNNSPHFCTRLDGYDFEQPIFRYHVKCRDFLLLKYNELSQQERRLLRTFLGDSGCLEALGRLHSE